jgi:hypothetical protein
MERGAHIGVMNRVWTIARREWKGFFDHATAYILLVVFLVLNFFFYFRAAFVAREASLRPMFELLPWLLLFFVPAVAMRSLAEEKRSGSSWPGSSWAASSSWRRRSPPRSPPGWRSTSPAIPTAG